MDHPRNKAALKIVLSLLLLGSLTEMEYGYYEMLCFAGMVAFILLALSDTEILPLVYLWAGSAILINPFVKFPFGKTIWSIVDVLWVLILIGSIFIPPRDNSPNPRKMKSPDPD